MKSFFPTYVNLSTLYISYFSTILLFNITNILGSNKCGNAKLIDVKSTLKYVKCLVNIIFYYYNEWFLESFLLLLFIPRGLV